MRAPFRVPFRVPFRQSARGGTPWESGEEEIVPIYLPFGSEDESIVFADPLTSDPRTRLSTNYGITASIAGNASGPTHDATKGMKATTGAANSGYMITLTSHADYAALAAALYDGGQLTIEVEKGWLVAPGSTLRGSDGDSALGRQDLITTRTASSNTNEQVLPIRNTSDWISPSMQGASNTGDSFLGWLFDATPSSFYIHSYGKPEFVRLNIGWFTHPTEGRCVILAVDGVTLGMVKITNTTATLWERIGIGGSLGGGILGSALINAATTHFFRNLQLSTKPPVVPPESNLGTVAILSDSTISAGKWYNEFTRDNSIVVRLHRAVEAKGKKLTLYRMQAGGHLMTELADGTSTYSFTNGNTATQVVSSGSTNASPRAWIKALNPDHIVINGGSNDIGVSAATLELFTASMRDHVEYFCGLNGHDAPSKVPKSIQFTNIMDRPLDTEVAGGWDATDREKAAAFREAIEAMPAWFAATYPSVPCEISVIDIFGATQGETEYPGKFDTDSIHAGFAGVPDVGDAIGAALALAA